MTRSALQQPTTELVRILTGFVRELVDEALDDERILRMTDAAPEPERNARVVEDMRDVDVRKRIRVIDGTLVGRRITRLDDRPGRRCQRIDQPIRYPLGPHLAEHPQPPTH